MEYQIYTGTVLKISKGFLNGSLKFMYCGMPSEKTFTLCPYISNGYQGFCPNIYYDVAATIIQIQDKTFEVLEVTREYIILGD